MLIQNNSNTVTTKYISIYLKELFNNNITVTGLYNNSLHNYFNVGDNILCNRYVARYNNSTHAYEYGYIIGEIGEVMTSTEQELITFTEETIRPSLGAYPKLFVTSLNTLFLTLGSSDINNATNYIIGFDTIVKLQKDITVIRINSNTGEFILDSESNYVINTWNNGTYVFTLTDTARNCNNLCSYIYEWLEDRYYPLFADSNKNLNSTVYSNNEIIECNIANYFAEFDNIFNNNINPDKLAFDIDDLVGSFLLGRTISDSSTPEEIEYVQNLIKHNHYLKLMEQDGAITISNYIAEPGRWGYLHQIIYLYQCELNSRYNFTNTKIVLPTGYLDIITEKYLLMEFEGTESENYFGESNNTLRTY